MYYFIIVLNILDPKYEGKNFNIEHVIREIHESGGNYPTFRYFSIVTSTLSKICIGI